MNKMPKQELAEFKADIVTAFISGMIVLIGLLVWLRIPPITVLVNEPCAPSQPTYENGERVGCTGDEPTRNTGYYPRGQRHD